jgi:hypothetical protein
MRSPLLQLVRDSIEEVIEAKLIINRTALLEQYPVLEQNIASVVTLKIGDELRGEAGSKVTTKPLIDDIIFNAKVAAFQDERFTPISTSQYMHATIELTLLIPDDSGNLHAETSSDKPILKD